MILVVLSSILLLSLKPLVYDTYIINFFLCGGLVVDYVSKSGSAPSNSEL